MNIKLIRILDYYLGIILCFLLSLTKSFFKNKKSNPNSILLIELSEMGSAILLMPIIEKIKNEMPDSKISFLIFKKHSQSVELCNNIERVITLDDSSVLNLILNLPSVIRELRQLKINYLLDCELFSRLSTIISVLSGAKNRSGFVAPKISNLYRGNLYSHPFVYNNLLHISDNYFALWKAFSSPNLPYLKQELDVSKKLNTVKINASNKFSEISENSVIFNPDPGLIKLRGWPIESYLQLAKTIVNKHDSQILIIGLNSAHQLGKVFTQSLENNCLNLIGKTESLNELLEVYSKAKVLVTADSGPAHLAPLVNLPVVVLFGPESPLRFAPLGEKVSCISSNLCCSPCLNAFNLRDSICNNNICMKNISVDAVYEKVRNYL